MRVRVARARESGRENAENADQDILGILHLLGILLRVLVWIRDNNNELYEHLVEIERIFLKISLF